MMIRITRSVLPCLAAGVLCYLVVPAPLALQAQGRGIPPPPVGGYTAHYQSKMTPVQREHAKLHKGIPGRSKVLDDPLDTVSTARPGHFGNPNDPDTSVSSEAALTKLACESDAVFVGVVTSAVSNPVQDGTYLFTDYNLSVTESIAGKRAVKDGSTVVLTRRGGRITLPTHRVVETVSSQFPLLTVKGEYLLFAKLVPATRGYQSIADGAFVITDGKAVPLSPLSVRKDDPLVADGFPTKSVFALLRSASCR